MQRSSEAVTLKVPKAMHRADNFPQPARTWRDHGADVA